MGHRCGPVARPAAEGAPAMSTVACPGCGMPRAAELIGETPCPVCGEIPPIAEELEPEPVAPSAPSPEPALPADPCHDPDSVPAAPATPATPAAAGATTAAG